jgi:UMF1 family MFS transporter
VIIALLGFAIATIGSEFATVFNKAMMPSLVDEERLGPLSGIGWGLGYVGGLVCLMIALGLLVADPVSGRTLAGLKPLFGLDPATHAGDRASGPLTAIWFTLFVLPLFLFTPDTPRLMGLRPAVSLGIRRLAATLRDMRGHANVLRFLIGHMIYADGLVAIFTFGGIYAAGTFGWTTVQLGIFGIIATVTGTIGGLAGGWFDDRLGPKTVILGSLAILMLIAIGILSIDRSHILFFIAVDPPQAGHLLGSAGEKLYLALGALIGMIAAPLQSASRTLIVRISPPDRMTQFFGLYALAGKLTSFSGPVAVALVTSLAGSQRLGVSVLILFFLAGGALVLRVAPRRLA